MTQIQIKDCYDMTVKERVMERKSMIGYSWQEGTDWSSAFAYFQTGPVPDDHDHAYTVARMTPSFVEAGIKAHVNALSHEWDSKDMIQRVLRDALCVKAEGQDKVFVIARNLESTLRGHISYGSLDSMARRVIDFIVQNFSMEEESIVEVVKVLPVENVICEITQNTVNKTASRYCYCCGYFLPEDMMHPFYREEHIPCMGCTDYLLAHASEFIAEREVKNFLLRKYDEYQAKKEKCKGEPLSLSEGVRRGRGYYYRALQKLSTSFRFIQTSLPVIVKRGVRRMFRLSVRDLDDGRTIVRVTAKSPAFQSFQYDLVGLDYNMGPPLLAELIVSRFSYFEGVLSLEYPLEQWGSFRCPPLGLPVPRDVFVTVPGSFSRSYVDIQSVKCSIHPIHWFFQEVDKIFQYQRDNLLTLKEMSVDETWIEIEDQQERGIWKTFRVNYPSYDDEEDEVRPFSISSTHDYEIERDYPQLSLLMIDRTPFRIDSFGNEYCRMQVPVVERLTVRSVLIGMGVRDSVKLNCVQIIRPEVAKLNMLRYCLERHITAPWYSVREVGEEMYFSIVFVFHCEESRLSRHEDERTFEQEEQQLSHKMFKYILQQESDEDLVLEESRRDRSFRRHAERQEKRLKALAKREQMLVMYGDDVVSTEKIREEVVHIASFCVSREYDLDLILKGEHCEEILGPVLGEVMYCYLCDCPVWSDGHGHSRCQICGYPPQKWIQGGHDFLLLGPLKDEKRI